MHFSLTYTYCRKVYKKSDPNKPWWRDYLILVQALALAGIEMVCLAIVASTTDIGNTYQHNYYDGVVELVTDEVCIVAQVQTYEIVMIAFKIAFLIYGHAKSVFGRTNESDQAEDEFLSNIYEVNVAALAYFVCVLVVFSPLDASARGIAVFVVVIIAVSVITIPKFHFSKRKTGQLRNK